MTKKLAANLADTIGADIFEISKAMANLAINLAASLNTYLLEEYDESIKSLYEKEI